MRSTLSLREPPDAPRVKEAKEIVAAALGATDPALVPWAMRMAEERDTWTNAKRKAFDDIEKGGRYAEQTRSRFARRNCLGGRG